MRPVEEAGQLTALSADKPAQAQLREVRGLGNAYVRIRGDQALLGGSNIRASFQQSRGQSGWNFRRQGVFIETAFAGDTGGILAQRRCNLGDEGPL